MLTPEAKLDPRQMVARIDAIIFELSALRRQLATSTKTAQGFTDLLFGSL